MLCLNSRRTREACRSVCPWGGCVCVKMCACVLFVSAASSFGQSITTHCDCVRACVRVCIIAIFNSAVALWLAKRLAPEWLGLARSGTVLMCVCSRVCGAVGARQCVSIIIIMLPHRARQNGGSRSVHNNQPASQPADAIKTARSVATLHKHTQLYASVTHTRTHQPKQNAGTHAVAVARPNTAR